MNLSEWLDRTAARAPTAPALFFGTAQLCDYAGFAARSAGLAQRLVTAGVERGDRVALWMANHPAYLVALFAIWRIGAVAVPVNAKLSPAEAAWIGADAGARMVFCDAANAGILGPVCAGPVTFLDPVETEPAAGPASVPCRPDDLAWIFYTSGTTGRPKGAMLSHGNLVAMSLAYLSDVDDVAASDCALYAAPLSHGAGLYSLVHVLRGARHAVPASRGFDAAEVLDLATHLRNVSLFAAPTMVRRLTDAALRSGRDGDGLKTVIYGGAPMYRADLTEALRVFGPRFVQIYGQGETPMTITVLDRWAHGTPEAPGPKIATVGRPHAIVEMRINGPDGTALPAGAVGEVETRGPTVMSGYWNQPQASAETLVDGWLRTGDIGSMDCEGYLTLTDRSKDVIITGGSNVYPREVEDVLLAHDAVREASVIGVPDPEWGEAVVAVLVSSRRDAGLEAELDQLCLDGIARFKRPKRYIHLSELPKNNYGKVLKTELRALLRAPSPSLEPADTAIENGRTA